MARKSDPCGPTIRFGKKLASIQPAALGRLHVPQTVRIGLLRLTVVDARTPRYWPLTANDRKAAAGPRRYFTTRSILRHSPVEPTFGLALGSSVPTKPPWLLVQ
jgi:hypothetical protein